MNITNHSRLTAFGNVNNINDSKTEVWLNNIPSYYMGHVLVKFKTLARYRTYLMLVVIITPSSLP